MTTTTRTGRRAPRSSTASRWWLAGFVVTSVAGLALSIAQITSRPILGARWALLDVLAAWSGVWVLGVICALRLPLRRGRALLAILVVGTALRVVSLGGTPTLSDDLYRYSWDAKVQLTGIDPYRYPPAANVLRDLRQPWLWPDAAGCAHIERPPGCTRINRPADRTIYPPVAEGWFTSVYSLGGGMGSRHKLWQAAGLVTELVTMGLIALSLLRRGRDPRWLALYALCPAPAVEIVGNGHVDGLALLFLVAAFLALSPRLGHSERRVSEISTWQASLAGLAIGLATLVKLYPVVALIPVWFAPGVRMRQRLASAATVVTVIVVGYLPHVRAVGVKVIGYLPGYLKEEHYTGTSSRYLLAGLLRVPGRHGTEIVVAVALAATVGYLAARRPPAIEGITILVGVALLCATPVQPWYAVTLLALATVARRPKWLLVVAAGYPYFFAVILSAKHQAGIGQISYGAAALAIVAITVAERSRVRRGVPPPEPAPVPAPS